jgi:enediyne biosynthesis protein E4
MRWPVLLLAALPAQAGAEAPEVPRFVEETAAAGLATPFTGDWEYMVGGGLAAFDCSGDGKPDLFLPGGEGASGLYRNVSATGGPPRFAPVTDWPAFTAATGAYPLDVDGDGILDLMVLRVGENLLLRGQGDCRFERANEAWGFDGGDAWSTAFAATWEPGADWPTLAVGNYIDRFEDVFPWGSCTDNWLHRPAAPGRFAPPLPLTPSHCALSILFTDWNRAGARHCACRTTANTTRAVRNSSGIWNPARPRAFTPPRKDGSACASGAWASRDMTSTPTAIRNIS